MVYFLDVIIVRCQGSNHRTSEDDWGVQFSSETKGNEPRLLVIEKIQ